MVDGEWCLSFSLVHVAADGPCRVLVDSYDGVTGWNGGERRILAFQGSLSRAFYRPFQRMVSCMRFGPTPRLKACRPRCPQKDRK